MTHTVISLIVVWYVANVLMGIISILLSKNALLMMENISHYLLVNYTPNRSIIHVFNAKLVLQLHKLKIRVNCPRISFLIQFRVFLLIVNNIK